MLHIFHTLVITFTQAQSIRLGQWARVIGYVGMFGIAVALAVRTTTSTVARWIFIAAAVASLAALVITILQLLFTKT